jgi:hypothetical protein
MASTRAQTLAYARTFRGVAESPAGSNRVLFSYWYGLIDAWCAMYISYVLAHTGYPNPFGSPKGTASCVALKEWAVRNGRWHDASWRGAQTGDLSMYHFGSDHSPDHVGLFIGYLPDGRNWDIEGNTGSNNRDGGSVQERYRTRGSTFVGFVHLDYPEPAVWKWPPFPGETLRVGDIGKGVADMKFLLILSGVAPELSRQTPEQFKTFGKVTTALAVMHFKHLWNLLNGFDHNDKLWLDPTTSAVGPTTWSCLVLSAAKHSGLH